VSRTRKRGRSELPTLQGIAHSTDFPDPEGARAATLNGNFLVRSDLQGASLNLTTTDVGMELIDVVTKWRALFLIRSRTQGDRSGSLTADWLNVRTSLSPMAKLPHIRAIPQTLEYLWIYSHELAYVEPLRQAETGRASRTLRTIILR
jgi:hypothetical protein